MTNIGDFKLIWASYIEQKEPAAGHISRMETIRHKTYSCTRIRQNADVSVQNPDMIFILILLKINLPN